MHPDDAKRLGVEQGDVAKIIGRKMACALVCISKEKTIPGTMLEDAGILLSARIDTNQNVEAEKAMVIHATAVGLLSGAKGKLGFTVGRTLRNRPLLKGDIVLIRIRQENGETQDNHALVDYTMR